MPRGSGPNAPRLDPVAQPRVIVARFTVTLERASVANCFAVTLQSRKCHQEGKRAWRESLLRAEPEEEAALDPERSDRRYRPFKLKNKNGSFSVVSGQASKQVRSVSPRKEKRPRNPRATKVRLTLCYQYFAYNITSLKSNISESFYKL